MKLSHSKLSKIMSCPMSYRLSYDMGIWTKVKKPALSIGSAVHYGIEHELTDLSEYFKSQGSFKQGDDYTKEQLLAESMVHGYLKHKDDIFKEILKDPETGETLELMDESHELYVTGKLKSFLKHQTHHDFIGIIDLLLFTNKGFIILDYKTSTYEPDWETYLDQIYRYIFMLRSEFPDVPIVKVGIINIKKSAIRQKKIENESQFRNRLMWEYETNTENYVNYHEFPQKDIDETLLNAYINNLSRMADCAQTIVDNKMFFINFSNAKGTYGKTDFYDIFYRTPNAYVMYMITDDLWDDNMEVKHVEKLEDGTEQTKITYGGFTDRRACVELDMRCADADYEKVLNKFKMFSDAFEAYTKNYPTSKTVFSQDDFFKYLKSIYYTDDTLLERYWETLLKKIELKQNTIHKTKEVIDDAETD